MKKQKLQSYSFQKVDANSPTNIVPSAIIVTSIASNNRFDQLSANIMAQKAYSALGLLSVVLLIQKSNAYEFKVGGPNGSWTVPPTDPNAAIYNQWAESNRFQTGDTLLFVYDAKRDSVLRVTKDDYTNCNTDSPLEKFSDGHTIYKFSQSGPHYFISGVSGNCHKNEKLHVIVMANRSKSYNGPTASPPSPSVAKVPSPAPAPSGEESPCPPSASAPSMESSPPKNGASFLVSSGVGTIGAFFCSWIVSAI